MIKHYRICDIHPDYRKILHALLLLNRDVRFISTHDGHFFVPSCILDITNIGSQVGLVSQTSVRFRRWKESDFGLLNWASVRPDTPNFDSATPNGRIHQCHFNIAMNFAFEDFSSKTFLIRSKFDDAHYIASVEYNSMIKLQDAMTMQYDHHICDSEFNRSNFDFIAVKG